MEPRNNETSYWNSVALAGLIFGLVVFALSVIGGYMAIASEPAGTLLGENMIMGLVSCLLGAFGGMIAVKLHVRDDPGPLPIGTGAVIGLTTGVAIALVSTVLSLLWNVVDPAFTENVMEATIANIDAMQQLPQAQREEMIDSVAAQMQQLQTPAGVFLALATNGLLYGILNMLTGMLGAGIFASREEA